jgi:hypothetical protein
LKEAGIKQKQAPTIAPVIDVRQKAQRQSEHQQQHQLDQLPPWRVQQLPGLEQLDQLWRERE